MPLLRSLLELLLPDACARCGRASCGAGPLCAGCDAALPRLATDCCWLCQQRRPEQPGHRCTSCASAGSPLVACLAAAPFDPEIARWIHRLKYPRPGLLGLDPAPAALARALLLDLARRAPEPGAWVLPVPLHPARLRQRGFNPAALLGRALARAWRLPFAPLALERTRDTPSQTGLDRRERARNVARAFRARPRQLRPGTPWLVDDVVTTGATLRASARALRRAGVRRVVALCVARTLDPDG